MNHPDLWNLTGAALAAISRHYDPVAERMIAESGLPAPAWACLRRQADRRRQAGLDARTWGLLMAALTFAPATTTPARMSVRGP